MRRATVLHTLTDRCMAYALFFFFLAYALFFFFLGDLPETSVQIVKLVTYFFSSYRPYSICRIPNMDSGLIL